MSTKETSDELRSQQLRLLGALDVLATKIADVANSLPLAHALDFVDRQLSNFAVQMRKSEGGLSTASASLGFAINVRLREKISERLGELES